MSKNILILAANPKDTPRLRLDQEVREIENGLSRSVQRDNFVIKQLWATRPVDIRRAMLDFKPNIVHFCGHGAGASGIAFEDDNGNTKLVSAEALSGFFELFSAKVECIVLNACYSEIQAEALRKHIGYVVGMNKGIGDSAAIEFAVAFYDAIGAGESFEFAFKLGCNAILWSGFPEHLTPILKTKWDVQKSPSKEQNYTEENAEFIADASKQYSTEQLRSLSPKEFLKFLDIPNPIDDDVLSFAAIKKPMVVYEDDSNAPEWASIKGLSMYESIEGFWSSRWYHEKLSRSKHSYELDGYFWHEGTAQIIIEENWVYIYYEDKTNQYAIIAEIKDSLLVGRYVNINRKYDTTPWIGKIVNNSRIDGYWLSGRWDFRR